MEDPDLWAPGVDPVLFTGLVMDQHIGLQRFNQIKNCRAPQLVMDSCAGKLKRPTGANREYMCVPAMSVVPTPHVEHALSATHGKVPRQEMDQAGTAVSLPGLCEVLHLLMFLS